MAPKGTAFWVSIVLLVTGVVFALAAPVDLITKGPFGWHIRQPGFWQGGIELAMLAALLSIVLYRLQGWYRILVLLALSEIYARRQGVDLAILISLFYFEGIAALGTLILRRFRIFELSDTERCLFGIMLGTLIWSCIEWILSALGPGSVRDLQLAALVVLGASLLLHRRLPVLSYVFSRVGTRSWSGTLFGTFVCTIVLMLFAKASVSIDYDSLWYGMRGDRVLVAAGSVFDGLGLVGPIHYGPQAYELLLVPLTRLRSVTAILGFSIWCWISLGICLYALTERLNWTPKIRNVAVALALVTPAVMNIAITTKGDVMGATWVFFGAYAIMGHRATRHRPWLLIAFFAALVATTFRMSVFLYAGVTGLFALGAWAISLIRREGPTGQTRIFPDAVWITFALAAAVLFALVTARTLLLAGVPFTEVSTLVSLAEHAGLALKFPVGGPAPVYPGFNANILPLLFDFLFRPATLPHIIITWTGAAFAYFLLIGFAMDSHRREQLRGTSVLWVLATMFPLLLIVVRFPIRGGDGNYFIVPILSMVLLGVGMTGELLCNREGVGRTLGWIAGLFVVSSIAVSLATGSWGPGTRAWDLDFTRHSHDYRERARYGINAAGLQLVDSYLKGMPAETRMVGIIPPNSNDTLPGSWLPVRYEAMEDIASTRPGYLGSPDSIEAFLRLDDIQYVLLPRSDGPTVQENALGQRSELALRGLHEHGIATPVVYSQKYVLWKLNFGAPPDAAARD